MTREVVDRHATYVARNDKRVEVPDFKLCLLITLVIANEIGPRANAICVGDK